MTPEEMEAFREVIAGAMAERRQPSASELLQRYVAIGASLLGIAVTLLAAVGWAISLQSGVQTLTLTTKDVQSSVSRMQDTLVEMQLDRYTRADQDKFVTDSFKPLEERVRNLEQAR